MSIISSVETKKNMWLGGTKQALDLYDRSWDKFCKLDFADMSREDNIHELNVLEVLKQNVGLTFGLETSDRNDAIDCYKYLKPGPKIPEPGEELSMVRKLVNEWEERCKKI